MPVTDIPAIISQWKTRHPLYKLYEEYDDGKQELKFVTPDWVSKYARQVIEARVLALRENLCPTVITVFVDSLTVTDWGINQPADSPDSLALTQLLGFMKYESWKTGDAYAIVWPLTDGTLKASFQRARMIVPHYDLERPEELDYAARVWLDSSKRARVNIYYRDRLERYETVQPIPFTTGGDWNIHDVPDTGNAWQEAGDEPAVIPHSFGIVPVVPIRLDAKAPNDYGRSILGDVMPLQDGLNSSLANLIVNQEAYSRPFWYLLNFRPEQQPVNPYLQTGTGTTDSILLGIPDPGTQTSRLDGSNRFDGTHQQIFTHDGPGPMGQLDPADLTHLLEVQREFESKICRVAGFPPYLLQGDIGNVPSGSALRRLERRRVAKISNWITANQQAFHQLKQLLGLPDGQVQFDDPDPLDPVEKWQIAQIKQGLGYALEDILEDVGESDVAGIVERANEAQLASTARVGQALLDGHTTTYQ